jgi:hypothetical protein
MLREDQFNNAAYQLTLSGALGILTCYYYCTVIIVMTLSNEKNNLGSYHRGSQLLPTSNCHQRTYAVYMQQRHALSCRFEHGVMFFFAKRWCHVCGWDYITFSLTSAIQKHDTCMNVSFWCPIHRFEKVTSTPVHVINNATMAPKWTATYLMLCESYIAELKL